MLLIGHCLLSANLLLAVADGRLPEETNCPSATPPASAIPGQQQPKLLQLLPPTVRAWSGTCGIDGKEASRGTHCCDLSSEDQPQSWTSIAPVSLSVEVQMHIFKSEAISQDEVFELVNCVQLLLDGTPLDAKYVRNANSLSVRFQFCPSPGKHLLQARYRCGSQWSGVSQPVLMDVQFPPPPEIISVSDDDTTSKPVPAGNLVLIGRPLFFLKLSGTNCDDKVNVYLNDRKLNGAPFAVNDCGDVCVQMDVPPGVYALTARTISSRYSSAVTSRPSKQVMIRYRPDDGSAEQVSVSSQDGRPKYPFSSVPRVQTISIDKGGITPGPTEDRQGESASGELGRAYRFHDAAHFPIREFGQRGEALDREGAVIFEEMEFLTYKNGRYQMNCLARTPAMPTTLRFRFLIKTGVEQTSPWQTITLPPIEIEPEQDSSRNARPTLSRIQHGGYSSVIDSANGAVVKIRREGTARFGFGDSL